MISELCSCCKLCAYILFLRMISHLCVLSHCRYGAFNKNPAWCIFDAVLTKTLCSVMTTNLCEMHINLLHITSKLTSSIPYLTDCPKCNLEKTDLKYIFWQCLSIQRFWTLTCTFLKDITGHSFLSSPSSNCLLNPRCASRTATFSILPTFGCVSLSQGK